MIGGVNPQAAAAALPTARGPRLRRVALASVASVLAAYYGPAVLERLLPRPWLRRFQRRLGNPGGIVMSRLPGWALIETTGRRTGQPRRVPLGGRLVGDSFWFVAVDPQHAGYVKNLKADPRVRVRVNGLWRTGVAQVLPDDDARRRMFRLNPANGLYIAIAGREHRTVRVDLEPLRPAASDQRLPPGRRR